MPYISALEDKGITRGAGVLIKTVVSSPSHATLTFLHNSGKTDSAANPFETFHSLMAKTRTMGGAQWNISAPGGLNFSNAVNEINIPDIITLKGYDYDRLISLAFRLRDSLMAHKRINEVFINSNLNFHNSIPTQFLIHTEDKRLSPEIAREGGLHPALRHWNEFSSPIGVGNEKLSLPYSISVITDNTDNDVWSFYNTPLKSGDNIIKINSNASSEPLRLPDDILRIDRQFIVNMQFDYIGDRVSANKSIDRILGMFTPYIPSGFSAEVQRIGSRSWNISPASGLIYGLVVTSLLVVFPTIFFNSLKAGITLLLTVMMSIAGAFVTFHHLDLKVDSGGILALLVAGVITVFYAFFLLSSYSDSLKALRNKSPGMPKNSEIISSSALSQAMMSTLPTVALTTIVIVATMAVNISDSFMLWDDFSKILSGGLAGSVIAVIIMVHPTFRVIRQS